MRTVEEGVKNAQECWEAKYNCAESVFRGICYAQGIELSDQEKMMATPFGGGVGRSEDLCGALTGGVMGIGIVMGRRSAEEDRLKSYDAAGKLCKLFKDRFGSTCCKVLNKSDFKSPDHRVRCGEFVSESTRLALEVIRGA